MDSSDSDSPLSKKSLKCTFPDCQSVFSSNKKLVIHVRKHTGERPFACDEPGCDKTYTNNSHLRRHKKVSHCERVDQTVLCDYEGCGAVLANQYSLKKHQHRRHNTDLYAFKCAECSQGFHRKQQLQQHVYLHTGEAPFSCDKCDQSFTTSLLLNKHKRRHRDYTCECGQVFYRWSLLLAHRKSCKKPSYTCRVCGKGFSHLGNYKRHELVHKHNSEKMVFPCNYKDCKRFYFDKKNLKAHILTFHKKINEGQKFKCTYPKCAVVLKTKRLLKLHLERHSQLKIRKKRAPRKDKGIKKKSVISTLIGNEVKLGDDSRKKENDTEDPLLKQCDLMLKLLHEKMVAVN